MLKKKPRQPCSCQGQTSEHRLISNCLSCGRIICDHEGLPCLFCSSRPPTSSPPPLASTFLPSSSFPPSSSPPSPSLEKALRMKEQLLAFDRNQSAENNVFDEQLDYFELNENVWLSKEVKEQAVKEIIEEKKVREEYNRGINVQFVDGKWEEVKEKGDENASKRKAQQLCQKSLQKERETREKEGSKGGESLSFDDRVGDQVYVQLRNEWNEKYKQYREKMEKKKCEGNKMFKVIAHDEGFSGGFVKVFEKKLEEIGGEKGDLNIYDREIFDLNGESGKCLSMLQPWASLMVEGFKRFEGRFWNTEYRGPLWVHAGATQPDPETIRRTENQYLNFYKNEKKIPPLPERYPTGCIIGIVDLQYVLPRADYEELIPNEFKEETDCDFLFVIRNPRKLVYPLKASGSKQIYDIDANLREKAKKLVVRVQTNWFKYIMDEVKYSEQKIEPTLKEEIKPKEEKEEIIRENERIDNNTIVEEVVSKPVALKRDEKNKNTGNDGGNEECLIIKRNYSKKIEKVSFCLQEVLLKEDQKAIIDILDEQLAGKKLWGPSNMISTFNEENFSFLKVFNEIIGKEGKNLKKKKFQMDVFYVNKKQKLFTFNGKYICLLNIGLELEIMVKSQDEVVLMEIKSGAMFFFDSKYQTSFQSVKENGKKGEAYSLIVVFY